MTDRDGRDLDLNLLRVFVVVAETGNVTQAASRLYLTQPGVSASLRRLTTAVGAPLFARQGRGIALTARGQRLLDAVRPHLQPLIDAALAPAAIDPRTTERTVRLGLSDSTESWLLPPLLRALAREAPRVRVISIPVQFRTVAEALASRAVDAAVTVADDLPAGVRRRTLFDAGFVCLHDPRRTRLGRAVSEDDYFAREHVIVSYNGDLRGVVEDFLGKSRRVRCSVSTFASIGAIVDGTALLATVPTPVARDIRSMRPHLRASTLPFALAGAPVELAWPIALDDDVIAKLVRDRIVAIAARAPR